MATRRASLPAVPLNLPSARDWCVKVLAQQDRFVLGLYRRQMRTIGCLRQLEKIFGVPVTTRNWNTILAIVRVLKRTDSVPGHH